MKMVKILSFKKIKIFLDMDGVISDFESGFNLISPNNKTVYNIDKDEMWKIINNAGLKFFTSMPVMDKAKELLTLLKDYDYTILSALPINPKIKKLSNQPSIKGKRIWLKRNLGLDQSKRAILVDNKKKKKDYVDNDYKSVLIDDNENNIRDWNDNGGYGFLYKAKDKNILSELKTFLSKLEKENND